MNSFINLQGVSLHPFPRQRRSRGSLAPDFDFARKIVPELIHVVGQVGGWKGLRCEAMKILSQNHLNTIKKDSVLIPPLPFVWGGFFFFKTLMYFGGKWSNFGEHLLVNVGWAAYSTTDGVKHWISRAASCGTTIPPGGISEPVPLTFVSHPEFRAAKIKISQQKWLMILKQLLPVKCGLFCISKRWHGHSKENKTRLFGTSSTVSTTFGCR